MQKIIILFSFLIIGTAAFSQVPDKNRLIQFSGVVVSGDSLAPVPFTSVMVKHSSHGTIADYYGFFSLVARIGDTVQFSSVGYNGAEFTIPDTLTDSRYSIIQLLESDTILLRETVVYPWPSKEQFREAFLTLNLNDDDYDRAFKNLARDEVRLAIQGVPMSANANYRYQMQKEYTRLYHIGQVPSISLLNPLAWAQFIEAWKRGDFNTKE